MRLLIARFRQLQYFGVPVFCLLASTIAVLAETGGNEVGGNELLRPSFNDVVAPILFRRCATCHRPGQSAPFSLLRYEDAKRHARQIARVTSMRYMPPWLPAEGFGSFLHDRRLSAAEIEALQLWAAQGAREGDPAKKPEPPGFEDDWQIGKPDLIVQMPQAFSVPAEGKDIYRSFAFLIPTTANKYVVGVELRPGNPRVLHHAFINVDETRTSRRQSERQGGIEGMELPESAIMPRGQMLSWQPGKVASLSPRGLSWLLKTNTDFVLQLHLHPSGKAETIQPSIGLFFTNEPPSTPAFRIILRRMDFKIPAGESNVVVEQSYRVPVDIEVTRILPHAHYLGKDLQCYALLPNGTKEWLVWIKDWDFNWQGDYEYKQPVFLQKGSTLWLRYTYDNSTNNVRNPNHPLRDVFHGEQTTDEMASVTLQATTRTGDELRTLARDFAQFYTKVSKDFYRFRIERDPTDPYARTRLGRILASEGHFEEAKAELAEAVRLQPTYDKAHYEFGYIYLLQGKFSEAYDSFQKVIRTNPDDYQAVGSLGFICLKTGRSQEAKRYLEKALALNPGDEVARRNLAVLLSGGPGTGEKVDGR